MFEMVNECIYECFGVIFVVWMYYYVWWFVDDNQVIVFEYDVEWNILWDQFQFVDWVRYYDGYFIFWFDFVIGFDSIFVDQDIFVFGCYLYVIV